MNILERALIGKILFVTGQPAFQDMFDNPYTGDVKDMKIRIRTFAKVKDILGADSFLECQDGTPMKELLKTLRERAGESEDQLFSKDGDLHNNLVLMINGTRIYKEDLDCFTLSEGDEITLFSPVSGG